MTNKVNAYPYHHYIICVDNDSIYVKPSNGQAFNTNYDGLNRHWLATQHKSFPSELYDQLKLHGNLTISNTH